MYRISWGTGNSSSMTLSRSYNKKWATSSYAFAPRGKGIVSFSTYRPYLFKEEKMVEWFFSLVMTSTYGVDQSSEEEELERNELITEKAIEEMSNEVMKALALQHPIMYKTYNISETVDQSTLAKFSIQTLQNICAALELDVASMTGKRKQPNMEIIEGVVATCGCKTSIE